MINNEHDQLLREDAYLIHPLQHRSDHGEPMICVRAEGTTLFDTEGHQYIDGLSGLWNVNVGHGRHELAKTAADQIVQLGYFSCYAGTTNIPAIRLASRLKELAPETLNHTFFTSGGAVSNDSAIKTARYFCRDFYRNFCRNLFSNLFEFLKSSIIILTICTWIALRDKSNQVRNNNLHL